MPVTLIKKPKAPKGAAPPLVGTAFREEAVPLVSGLDLSNRTTRTPLGWITDGSPSMKSCFIRTRNPMLSLPVGPILEVVP
jgi:hypothetical protein